MSSIKEKHIIKLMTVPLPYHKEITVVRGKMSFSFTYQKGNFDLFQIN